MAVIASLAAALQPLAGRVQAVARALRNRRAVGRLAELDAHQLKDIGLTRGQVTGALEAPLLSDPSTILADIAGRGGTRRRAEGGVEASVTAPSPALTPRGAWAG